MFALGQMQTLRRPIAMSALPPKADIAGRQFDVCFVPKADIPAFIRFVQDEQKVTKYRQAAFRRSIRALP
jgi:hypothetical protein